jgi:hypothetical protein
MTRYTIDDVKVVVTGSRGGEGIELRCDNIEELTFSVEEPETYTIESGNFDKLSLFHGNHTVKLEWTVPAGAVAYTYRTAKVEPATHEGDDITRSVLDLMNYDQLAEFVEKLEKDAGTLKVTLASTENVLRVARELLKDRSEW